MNVANTDDGSEPSRWQARQHDLGGSSGRCWYVTRGKGLPRPNELYYAFKGDAERVARQRNEEEGR